MLDPQKYFVGYAADLSRPHNVIPINPETRAKIESHRFAHLVLKLFFRQAERNVNGAGCSSLADDDFEFREVVLVAPIPQHFYFHGGKYNGSRRPISGLCKVLNFIRRSLSVLPDLIHEWCGEQLRRIELAQGEAVKPRLAATRETAQPGAIDVPASGDTYPQACLPAWR